MIEVKNSKGEVKFKILNDGRLWDCEMDWISAHRNQLHFSTVQALGLIPISTSVCLTGELSRKYSVGRSGDIIRWIGRDGVGSWDLWRTAGTRVDRAYVAGDSNSSP